MIGRLTGKVVVVTGAARGQGAAEVRRLRAESATVLGCDVAAEPDEDLERAEFRQLDVTDPEGWRVLVDELGTRFGRVDALVANAGITWRAGVTELEPADLARVCEVNVTGTLLGARALLPWMTAGSSIVVVGSAAALTGHYAAAYTASKWSLRGLAKTASLELGERGIRVNTIHPGYIETPMVESAPSSFRAANLAATPLGRAGTVDDVAPLVAFLVSDESSFISGADIPVDGGMTAHGGAKSLRDAVVGDE